MTPEMEQLVGSCSASAPSISSLLISTTFSADNPRAFADQKHDKRWRNKGDTNRFLFAMKGRYVFDYH